MKLVTELRTILGPLRICGTMIFLFIFLISNKRFRENIKKDKIFLDYKETLPLSVYIAKKIETPCLFGFFRPAIYLTEDAASDNKIQEHAIAHELTHYRHKDHIWSFLRGIALAIHW